MRDELYKKDGFVRSRINHVHTYGCYAPPSATTAQYQEIIDSLALAFEEENCLAALYEGHDPKVDTTSGSACN